jgi:hypothetical protein
VLIDYVLATRSEAEGLAASIDPSKDWPTISANHIEHVKLGRLMSILSSTSYDPGFVGECEQLAEGSDEGPFVFQVPPRLVSALAQLAPDQVHAVGKQWSNAEEFALDHWTREQVIELLERLRGFAQTAAVNGKQMLMWVSL